MDKSEYIFNKLSQQGITKQANRFPTDPSILAKLDHLITSRTARSKVLKSLEGDIEKYPNYLKPEKLNQQVRSAAEQLAKDLPNN